MVGACERVSLVLGTELVEGASLVVPDAVVGASLIVEGAGADDGAALLVGAIVATPVELGAGLEPDEGRRDRDDKFDGRMEGSLVLGMELVDGLEVVPDPVDGESLGATLVKVLVPGDGAELVVGEAVVASLLLGAELVLGDAVVASLLLGAELTDGGKVDPGDGGRNCEGKLDGRVVGISERVSLVLGAELVEGAEVVDPDPLVGAALVVEVVGADDGAALLLGDAVVASAILGEALTEEGNIDPDDGSRDCEGKFDGSVVGV